MSKILELSEIPDISDIFMTFEKPELSEILDISEILEISEILKISETLEISELEISEVL